MKKYMLMIVIAGLSMNAHAVCVMPDGSLDDNSIPPTSVAVEMLPACEKQAAESNTMKDMKDMKGMKDSSESIKSAFRQK